MIAGVVLALHLLGAVVWVGGMFFALIVLRPSLSVLEPTQHMALHRQIFRRFFLVVWHAMPVILITGYVLLFGIYGGFAGAGWNMHLMHLLGLIMAVVFVVLFFGPWKRFRRADDAAALTLIRRLITLNLVLGLLTIIMAALNP